MTLQRLLCTDVLSANISRLSLKGYLSRTAFKKGKIIRRALQDGSNMSTQLRVAELCGKNMFMVSPRDQAPLDMTEVTNILSGKFKMKIKSRDRVAFEHSSGISITLTKPRKMLIKGIKDEETALRIYDEIMDHITHRS